MASSILFKRGTEATIPTLASGEAGWTTDTHKLFVGDGSTNHQIGAGGSGTVTSVALTAPSFLSVAGSPVTTSGTLALTLATQAANTVFAGPTSGGAAAPTFRTLVAADIPDLSATYLTVTAAAADYQPLDADLTALAALSGTNTIYYRSAANTWSAVTIGSGLSFAMGTLSATGGGGSGTVTSVDMTVPSFLAVSGNPITTSGTLAVSLAFQLPNKVFAGPSSGSSGPPTFRALVAADIPDLSATYQPLDAQLTSLAGLTYTGNASKVVRVNAAETGFELASSVGTVTSVSGSGGTTGLTLTGGPITGSGTLTIGGTLAAGNGGTGQAVWAVGDVPACDSANHLTQLAGNATTTRMFLTQTGTGSASALPLWAAIRTADMPSGVPTAAATQSDQEAASSNTVYATPGRQQYHPSAAKAWVRFSISGGVVTVDQSYGVASVSRAAAGDYTVTWTTAFSAATYCVEVTASGVSSRVSTDLPAAQVVGSQRVLVCNPTTGALTEATFVCVAAFGDLP